MTTAAPSAIVNNVEAVSFGPVGTSATELGFFHFATVFWLIPQRSASALRLA